MLRMKVGAVILMVIFLGICIHALYPFTQVEQFTGIPAIDVVAPTRAADCNCLPGYIPTAENLVNYGGEIKMQNMSGAPAYFFKPNKSNKWYLIYNNTCDIPNVRFGSPNNSNYKRMTTAEFQQAMTNWGNFLTCDLLKKTVSPKKSYFCQSLTDTSLKRKCY